jgi:hypothetical protein
VVGQFGCCVECLSALLASRHILALAGEWIDVLMSRFDVFVQGLTLAEDFVAWWVSGTLVLVWSIMDRLMLPKALTSREGFITSLACALEIPNFGVGTFDVGIEMTLLEVRLVATRIWTSQGALISMGPQMFLKTDWTIEGFVATLVRTYEALLTTIWAAS